MHIESILFYFFSGLTIMSGVMVISSKNPVHSVLFLILVFFNSTGLFLLLGVEFIAMIILMVYVGAVAVLFLFIVMMLNVRVSELNESIIRYLPVGGIVGVLFFVQLMLTLDGDFISSPSSLINPHHNWYNTLLAVSNIDAIGGILYTNYAYAFIASGMVLLVAMIGAIVLTMYKRGTVRRQDIFVQLTRDFDKVIYLKD